MKNERNLAAKLFIMNYVYILRSQYDGELYIGCTNDLKKRFREHNSGLVVATRDRIPFELVYYEAFANKSDAFVREQWLKSGWGRHHMKKMLSNTIKSSGGQV